MGFLCPFTIGSKRLYGDRLLPGPSARGAPAPPVFSCGFRDWTNRSGSILSLVTCQAGFASTSRHLSRRFCETVAVFVKGILKESSNEQEQTRFFQTHRVHER